MSGSGGDGARPPPNRLVRPPMGMMRPTGAPGNVPMQPGVRPAGVNPMGQPIMRPSPGLVRPMVRPMAQPMGQPMTHAPGVRGDGLAQIPQRPPLPGQTMVRPQVSAGVAPGIVRRPVVPQSVPVGSAVPAARPVLVRTMVPGQAPAGAVLQQRPVTVQRPLMPGQPRPAAVQPGFQRPVVPGGPTPTTAPMRMVARAPIPGVPQIGVPPTAQPGVRSVVGQPHPAQTMTRPPGGMPVAGNTGPSNFPVQPGMAPMPMGLARAPALARPAASPAGVIQRPPMTVGQPLAPRAPLGAPRPTSAPVVPPRPTIPAPVTPVKAPTQARQALAQLAPPSGDRDTSRNSFINMDDLRESFQQVFGGSAPKVTKRADPGKEGSPIDLRLNLFEIRLPTGSVYQYDIEIFAEKKRKDDEDTVGIPLEKRARCANTLINRKVIESLGKRLSAEMNMCVPAYDGRKTLYVRKKMHFTEHVFGEIEVEENGEIRLFNVNMKYVATVSFDALLAMYENQRPSTENFQDAIQAADIIIRTGPTLAFTPVGRSFFSPPTQADGDCNLGGGREVWFGVYSSIRLGSWKPLVNLDMSATAFYSAGPLLDFVATTIRKRKEDLVVGLNDIQRAVVNREIRTLKVTATHLESKRQHRLEGLTRLGANKETFECDGSTVTVAQYFANKYDITLKYPNLPCVQAGKNRTMLPIELCFLVAGQHCKKKLDEDQTAKMIRKTALSPKDRFNRIKNSIESYRANSKIFCDEFSMAINRNPIEIQGRILPPPAITYGENKKGQVRDGVWRLDKFFKPAPMQKWAIAVLANRVGNDKIQEVVKTFQSEGAMLGMKVAPPEFIKTFDAKQGPRKVLQEVKSQLPDVDMTLVVLDPQSDYGLLKAEAETTDLDMRTQCVKGSNVAMKFNKMFGQNLLQKINTKLGGENNGVISTSLPDTFKAPFMAVGIDVNHPGPGDSQTPSVAAMVASLDRVASQYHAVTRVQLSSRGARQEFVVDTEVMFLECLTAFQQRKNILPKEIVIFRDGVSEGQFDAVRMYELGALRRACTKVRSDYTPNMLYVIVQKRHHVRMMPKNDAQGSGKPKNIPPGTIVDSKVVSPSIFDFYLCSHQGIQGTSRPAHYHVVHDDANHSPDEVYKICYYLCHTYARCTRSVSIPAPAYYAHLAAFRAKEHIKGKVQLFGSHNSVSSGSPSNSSSSEEDLDKFQIAQKVSTKMRGQMYFV